MKGRLSKAPLEEPYQTSYVVDYWACGAYKCDSWHTSRARAYRCPKRRKQRIKEGA